MWWGGAASSSLFGSMATGSTASTLLDWKSIGSILATFMFLRTALRDFIPPELYGLVRRLFTRLFASIRPQVTLLVDEYDSSSYSNELFDAVQSYLGSRCISTASTLRISKSKNSKSLTFSMDAAGSNQPLNDTALPGCPVRWTFHSVERKQDQFRGFYPSRGQEHRFFELSFHHSLRQKVRAEYLPYVMEQAEAIRFKNRERRLYTNRSGDIDHGGGSRMWASVPFHHPASFDTLAVDPAVREDLKADLDKFVQRSDYYARVGRAWKRGYLLYGPPGTGKTSLIAAIVNYLDFDVYDLELTAVTSNSQLRKLLISTSSKSVVVVEDVDCTLDLSDRGGNKDGRSGGGGGKGKGGKKQPQGSLGSSGNVYDDDDDCNPPGADDMDLDGCGRRKRRGDNGTGSNSSISLSGVLNFVDGLWSSCVGERLMVFTTNHLDKLDPALLRPGRMDKRVHLSYCQMPAFRTLARNYLYVEEGQFEEMMVKIEAVLPKANMTPADIAEIFLSCNDDAGLGLRMAFEEMERRVASMAAADEAEQLAAARDREVALAGTGGRCGGGEVMNLLQGNCSNHQ